MWGLAWSTVSQESLQGLAVKDHWPWAGYRGAIIPGLFRSAQGVSSASCLKGSGSWTPFLKLVICYCPKLQCSSFLCLQRKTVAQDCAIGTALQVTCLHNPQGKL